MAVQREKVNEALAHYFIMFLSEDKERFLDFLGSCSQSCPGREKNMLWEIALAANMLWEIALAAVNGYPALLNASAKNFERISPKQILDKLLMLLQETARNEVGPTWD